MRKQTEQQIIPNRSLISVLKSLPQYWELFYTLVRRNITLRYKRTYLGLLWIFLQPVLFTVIFSIFVGDKIGRYVSDYPIFLYSGLTLWSIFSSGFYNGATSLVNQREMLQKVYFPRLMMPLSHVCAGLFDFCILLFSLIIFLLYTGIDFPILKFALCSLIAVSMLLIISSAASLFFSSLTIQSRDLHHAMPFVIQILLFVSPIIYPTSFVEGPLAEQLLSLNPITEALNIFRAGIFDQSINITKMVVTFGVSNLILLISLVIFNQKEQKLTDYL